jgi:hypothetical protein
MSQSVQVLHVASPAMPRGSSYAAAIWQVVAQMFRDAFGHDAAQSSRVEEAAAVRQLAARIQRDDPRLAADLYAAAGRHELGE